MLSDTVNPAAAVQEEEAWFDWPGTDPQSSYCQNVQPRPPQLLAGTVGLPTNQWATHRTV